MPRTDAPEKPPRAAAVRRLPNLERAVIKRQRLIAAAQSRVLEERNADLVALADHGYTQQAITDLLNEANALEGVGPYSVDAVQKALRRYRAAR